MRRPFLWGVFGGRCVDCFCRVCLVVGSSKLQQPEQEQKGAKTWPKASISIEGEGTLGILWALFLGLPCPSLRRCFAVRGPFLWGVSGGRCVEAAGSGAAAGAGAKKELNSGQKHQFL